MNFEKYRFVPSIASAVEKEGEALTSLLAGCGYKPTESKPLDPAFHDMEKWLGHDDIAVSVVFSRGYFHVSAAIVGFADRVDSRTLRLFVLETQRAKNLVRAANRVLNATAYKFLSKDEKEE